MRTEDTAGFTDFVSAEQAALLRLAVLLTGDRGHAEDLVQSRADQGVPALGQGAPLRRSDGRVVAAISLGGPTTRFPPARIRALAEPIRQAAGRISQRLGWWPPEPAVGRRSATASTRPEISP